MTLERSGLSRLDDQIARLLLEGGFVNASQMQEAVKLAKEQGMVLRQALVSKSFITDETYATFLSMQLRVPLVDLRQVQVDSQAVAMVPEDVARKYNVLPLGIDGDALRVAMDNPQDVEAINTLTTITGRSIKPRLPTQGSVKELLNRYYKSTPKVVEQLQSILGPGVSAQAAQAEGGAAEKHPQAPSPLGVGAGAPMISTEEVSRAPIVKAVDMIIAQAVQERASDIHIEPMEDNVQIRYRIDGALHHAATLPKGVQSALISRIKVTSGMDIAEHRKPQDGRFSGKFGGQDVDFRVASVQAAHGEKVVIRILNKSTVVFSLEQLGFLPDMLRVYQQLLSTPFGMVLVSGPTGSGKTTTLYASLLTLDAALRNICTIEDPIEYNFRGINQTQVNEQAGVTFATGLRGLMRMDPNVILVGEIRDQETARVAIQAALTGHLVLTTIHANDSASAIVRLIDLGVEPFLVNSALAGSVAQRLVRRVCKYCKALVPVAGAEAAAYQMEMQEERAQFYQGRGCNLCSRSGFTGRVGVYEVLVVNDAIRRAVSQNAGADQIRDEAIKSGLVTLRRDGMVKARDGITTPGEIMRSVFSISW